MDDDSIGVGCPNANVLLSLFLASRQPDTKYPDDLLTNYKSAVDRSSIQIEKVVELLLQKGLD